jgi:hypothetical protein
LGILNTAAIGYTGTTAMEFDVVAPIVNIERIAKGAGLRQRRRLRRLYGRGEWVKRKGTTMVRLADGTIRVAELHWYEAHGIGRKEIKIKRFLVDG